MAFVCGVIIVLNAIAQHSTNPNVTYVTFEARGWEFAPVTDDSRVVGFLARFIDGNAVGNNIAVMWCEQTGDGEWTTWGWDHNDAGLAVLWVRDYLDDDAAFSLDHVLAELAVVSDENAVEQPIEMVSGLFWGDPLLEPVVESTDPEASLEVLVEQGHEAAPVLSPLAASTVICGTTNVGGVDAMLTLLAVQAEVTFFGVAATTSNNCTLACQPCVTTWGTPTCGAWVWSYTAPGTGSKTCHYTRSCSNTWTKSGERRIIFCVDCGNSGTHSYTEHGRTTVGSSDPCVPPPP